MLGVITNWDKISTLISKIKNKFDPRYKEEKLIECLRDYLVHYGYDFDNGKGRNHFYYVDLAYDIGSVKIVQWVESNYDEAINELIIRGYLERVETAFTRGGVRLTQSGRHYYTQCVKQRVAQSIGQIEKHVIQ